MTQSDAEQLEECLGYRFKRPELLERALTHSSAVPELRAEHKDDSAEVAAIQDNERLEFLGDAILGAIVCEALYHRFPDAPEGELTRIKSSLVSRSTCAVVADQLGLDRFLILGKGLLSHQQIPSSILAGVFESAAYQADKSQMGIPGEDALFK